MTFKFWLPSIMLIWFSGISAVSVRAQKADIAGKYGVCVWEGEESHAATIQLILNSDFTFTYLDQSDAEHPVNVSGKWSQFEGDIFLADYPAGAKIPKIWKTEKNNAYIKARKGTAYYRLCRTGEVVSR